MYKEYIMPKKIYDRYKYKFTGRVFWREVDGKIVVKTALKNMLKQHFKIKLYETV